MSSEEADHIVDVAYGVGFSKSDIHLDPVAKDHAKTLRSTEGQKRFIFNNKKKTVRATSALAGFHARTLSWPNLNLEW